jgi:hypothetical protein
MSETQTVDQQQELEALLEQIKANFNPLDYMPPSLREIASLTREELQSEYELVLEKQSNRSAAQRKWILERHEHLFNQQQEQDGTTK